MSDSEEISFIVQQLRQPPFNVDLDLASLDEKDPVELLVLLNTVIAHVDKSQERDITVEPPEEMAMRIIGFVSSLSFRTSVSIEDFKESLLKADKGVVYSIMAWLLKDIEGFQKRAYLARFLRRIEVPEQYAADPDVLPMVEEYEEAMEQFKQVHKAVDQRRRMLQNPLELQKELSQLDMEKEQLGSKIARKKVQAERIEGWQDKLSVVSQLKAAQDASAQNVERLKDQESQLRASQTRLDAVAKRLRDVQEACHDDDPRALLQRLEEDTDTLRDNVQNHQPEGIKAKKARLHRVQLLLDMHVSEQSVRDLQREVDSLNGEVSVLLERQQRMQNPGDEKLAMYRQQSAAVAKRKADLRDKIQMLKEDKDRLDGELAEKERESAQKGGRLLRGDEWKEFKKKVNAKREKCIRCKKVLSETKAEAGVLQRTESILKQKLKDEKGFIKYFASRGGESTDSGTHSTITDSLGAVSEQAAELNELKGKTLEEISRIVTDIQAQLKEKKGSLAPQIKDLRTVRTEFTELEQKHAQKKTVYSNTAVSLTSEKSKLETEVKAITGECTTLESQFHVLNQMVVLLEAQLDRVSSESRGEKVLGQFRGYREAYQHRTQELENLSKTLRERQREVKEGHDDNLLQMEMFRDLKKLMQAKLKCVREEQMQFADGAQEMMAAGGANVLTLGM